jgi:hypothetical protein
LKRAPSYEDTLLRILEDAGHPLTFEQILAQLVKLRPYYDESSITLTLGTNGRFRVFPGNLYGLAEWKEEHFTLEYRVQRLLEAGDAVVQRQPKRDIVEAMNSVGSFVARVRERLDDES